MPKEKSTVRQAQRKAIRTLARAENRGLLVKMPNVRLNNVFGEPLRLVADVRDDGTPITQHADVVAAIKTFLRARDSQSGQSRVVKSLEDAERVRVIGMAVQNANKMVEMPVGEHKWLLGKAKELGHFIFPTDITMFIEALEDTKHTPEAEEEQGEV